MSLKTVKEIIPGASDDIGAKGNAAVTDPAAEGSIIAVLKGLLKQLQGDGSGSAPIMIKGSVTTAIDAKSETATSDEIDCLGFNAVSVECAVSAITSGNWIVEILGCAESGGTFGNCYAPKDDGNFVQQKPPILSANGNTTYYFRGVPNFVKIKATRTTDGTITVKVTPINL